MPPTPDDIQRYVQCMEIIKLRIEVINKFLLMELSTGMPIPDIECICLQFRMVFESIALSSLCAHRAWYEQIKKRFSKEWDANKIIKTIESFNPNFYPVPIVQILDASEKSILRVERKRDGFMTRNEYQKAFNRCHDFLHEQNPYDWKQPNVTELWTMFTEWKSKIIGLLDCHIIPFETDPQLWVVMKAVSDGKVREDSVVVKQMTKVSKVVR